MSQSVRYCTMRQIHSNLYSCSAKLLWVFKLAVMFSNWNINLFKPLIWLPQWRITKYFIVSDLLKFYNQPLLLGTLYSWCSAWGSGPCLRWVPRAASRHQRGAPQVSPSVNIPVSFIASFSGTPTHCVVRGSRY